MQKTKEKATRKLQFPSGRKVFLLWNILKYYNFILEKNF